MSIILTITQIKKHTFEANLVKCIASSNAESPPPITAIGLFLYMGKAPSHTAHADTPLCHNSPSFAPGIYRRLATAPKKQTDQTKKNKKQNIFLV